VTTVVHTVADYRARPSGRELCGTATTNITTTTAVSLVFSGATTRRLVNYAMVFNPVTPTVVIWVRL